MSRDVTVALVGDLVPSRANRLTAAMAGFLKRPDAVFGNLEITAGMRGVPADKPFTMRAPAAAVPSLSGMGFSVVSLANNHAMDFGHESLLETIGQLDDLGIQHCGGGRDLDEAETAATVTVGGTTIAFLGWSCILPPAAAASRERPGIAPVRIETRHLIAVDRSVPGMPLSVDTMTDIDPSDLGRVQRKITRVRRTAQVVIVAVHWGLGKGEEIAAYQREFAQRVIEAGASVVFGGHVHDAQGIEFHRGRPIIFSAGNFIAQAPRDNATSAVAAYLDSMSRDGYVLILRIRDGAVREMELRPTVIAKDGLPRLANGGQARRIRDKVLRRSSGLPHEIDAKRSFLVTLAPAGPRERSRR